ncbi:hypothetical protein LTR60_006061, partial [Cryomyces antarcticus]
VFVEPLGLLMEDLDKSLAFERLLFYRLAKSCVLIRLFASSAKLIQLKQYLFKVAEV